MTTIDRKRLRELALAHSRVRSAFMLGEEFAPEDDRMAAEFADIDQSEVIIELLDTLEAAEQRAPDDALLDALEAADDEAWNLDIVPPDDGAYRSGWLGALSYLRAAIAEQAKEWK